MSPRGRDESRPPKPRPRRLWARTRPPLTIARILARADDHHARTGRWPTGDVRAVLAEGNEKWCNLYAALQNGHRGLPGNSSLARLLAEHRGVRNKAHLPVAGAPGETRGAIQRSLFAGGRGPPGGDSIARLLRRHGRRG